MLSHLSSLGRGAFYPIHNTVAHELPDLLERPNHRLILRIPRLRIHATATRDNKFILVRPTIRIHNEQHARYGLMCPAEPDPLCVNCPSFGACRSWLLKPVFRQSLQIIDNKQISHLLFFFRKPYTSAMRSSILTGSRKYLFRKSSCPML